MQMKNPETAGSSLGKKIRRSVGALGFLLPAAACVPDASSYPTFPDVQISPAAAVVGNSLSSDMAPYYTAQVNGETKRATLAALGGTGYEYANQGFTTQRFAQFVLDQHPGAAKLVVMNIAGRNDWQQDRPSVAASEIAFAKSLKDQGVETLVVALEPRLRQVSEVDEALDKLRDTSWQAFEDAPRALLPNTVVMVDCSDEVPAEQFLADKIHLTGRGSEIYADCVGSGGYSITTP